MKNKINNGQVEAQSELPGPREFHSSGLQIMLPPLKANISYLLESYIDRDFLMNADRNNKTVQTPNL